MNDTSPELGRFEKGGNVMMDSPGNLQSELSTG
jgi:hypothetical protein